MTRRTVVSWVSQVAAAILMVLAGVQGAMALTLSGTIYGGGSPLQNASVSVVNAATAASVGTAVTTSSGAYSFTVDNGTYNLTVTPPGGSGFNQSVVNGIVVNGSNVTQNVILIQQAVTVSGVIKGFGGAVVPSLDVRIYDQASNAEVGATTTNSSGQFNLSVLPGTYKLRVYNYYSASNLLVPGYFYYYPVTNLVVNSSTTLPDINIPAVKVSGKTVDAGGAPVGNVSVKNEYKGGLPNSGYIGSSSVQSNSQGDYSILVFASSGYNFTLDPPSGSGFARTLVTNVDASATVTKNMVLSSGATVTGVVRGFGNAVVPSIEVRIYDQTTNADLGVTYTNASGQFTLSVVPGTYKIRIYNYYSASTQVVPGNFYFYPVTNLAVSGNTIIPDINVPAVKISGKVVDSKGAPVAGISVANGAKGGLPNSGSIGSASVQSGPQGDYGIILLEGTGYSFNLEPSAGSGYARTTITNVDVTTSITKDLVVNSAGTVKGVVRGFGGAPVPSLDVRIYDQLGTEVGATTTNSQGQYTLSVMPGTYKLRVYNFHSASSQLVPNYFYTYPLQNVAVAGSMVLPDVVIPSVRISGKTTDSNGVPVSGVAVMNSSKSGLVSGGYVGNSSVVSNAQGDYSLLVLSGTGYSFTLDPPSSSGFARTFVNNIDVVSSISQGIILNIPDTTSPVIMSGPVVSSITDSKAVVEWRANEPVVGTLYYGDTNPPTAIIPITSPKNMHSQNLTNLTADTIYYVQVTAVDAAGNGPVTSPVVSFRTNAVADSAAPIIMEGPSVTSITSSSAVVTWLTNEPSNGKLLYGTVTPPTTAVTESVLKKSHSVKLTGLKASTLYFVKIEATDEVGNGPATSQIVSFKTSAGADVTPPAITGGPLALDISDTEATIVWQTDEPATSGVSYNDGTVYGVGADDTLTTSHSIRLTGLSPSTVYTYRVSSRDSSGNGPTLSQSATFTTAATPDLQAPVIVERSIVVNATQTTADIHWRTDEASNSVVEFGLADTLGSTESNSAMVTNHSMTLVGLQPDTLYYFRVKSTDAAGNGPTTSDILTFKTSNVEKGLNFTVEPKVIYLSYDKVTISWETDNLADSVIEYWKTTANVQRVTDSKREKKHVVTIANLSPSTTYKGTVISSDLKGNSVRLPITFTTIAPPDTVKPQIIDGPRAIGITDSKASIQWRTDRAADSRVSFGVQGAPLTGSAAEPKFKTEHVVVLTNLLPGTTYEYTVTSVDPQQNSVTSSIYTFTTKGANDTTGPTIGSGPTVKVVGDTRAEVTWTTGEPATSQVFYGTAETALDQIAAVPGLSDKHMVTLTGLQPGTTYYLKAVSADTTGNETASAVISFTTGSTAIRWTVTPVPFNGGSITPSAPQQVDDGKTASFTISLTNNSTNFAVTGCSGVLADNVYTTGPVHADCSVAVTILPPITVTVKPSIASPQTAGTPVTFTATASGGTGSYEYQFWLGSGVNWTKVADYSSSNSWQWDTTGLGATAYSVQVNVRNAGSLATMEASGTASFTIAPPPKPVISLAPSVASPQNVGTAVTFTANVTGVTGTYEFQFWLHNGVAWTKVQDYTSFNTWQWNTAGITPGTYTIQANARAIGSTAASEASTTATYTITLPPKPTITVSASPASPQIIGTDVTFTATGAGGIGTYEYEFWQLNGSTWVKVRDYSSDNTWTWSTAGLAAKTYTFQVNIRNAGSTSSLEASATVTFAIALPPKPTVTLAASAVSPQVVGSPITFTATGAGGIGSYEYQFWLYNGSVWTKVKDYSPVATWSWDTTGLPLKTYTIQANVRNSGSSADLEASATSQFTLAAPPKPTVSLSSSAPTPQVAGTSVTFTATGTGGTGAYEYQFWFHNGVTWTKVRDYSSVATWVWDTTGLAANTYKIQVNVRNGGSMSDMEASAVTSFAIALPPKPTVTVSSSVASPQPTGTAITFTATGAGGTGAYQYQFWLNNGGTWTLAQDYSSTNTWAWNTTGLTPNTYTIQVNIRNAGSTSALEASATTSYNLTPPPKPTVAVSSSVASPQVVGTSITFTATGAGGSGSLEYQFWLYNGVSWTKVQDYTSANTWIWNTTGLAVKTYQIQANVRNVGSTSALEGSALVAYTLSVPPKPTVTLSSSVPTPQASGTSITFTATGAGGTGSYEYQYWLHNGTNWTMVQDYSATNTWTWNTTGLASKTYTIQANIRNTGSTSAQEGAVTMAYALLPPLAPPKPTLSVTTSVASPQPTGTSITFTATGAGGSGSYEYQFWLNNGGSWTKVQEYGAGNTWAWNTNGLTPKTYQIQVNVRNVGSTAALDASTLLSYVITLPPPPPNPTITFSPSVASPQWPGASITFTATGAGGTGAYEYQYWLYNGSSWAKVKDYSSVNTWVWNTTGLAPRTYTIQANIRNVGSTSAIEGSSIATYTIIAPPMPTITVSPSVPSPRSAGTPVTFTATGAGGTGSYEFQFWLDNGTSWTKVQDYGPGNTWTWNTTGLPARTYRLQVNIRNAGSTAQLESSSLSSYVIQ